MGVSIGHVAAVEVRMLRRAAGWPLALTLGAVLGLLLLQEPPFARGAEAVPFVRSGMEGALVLACLGVPLMWILVRGELPRAVIAHPGAAVLGWTAGICGFAVAVTAVALGILVTVERISAAAALASTARLALATAPLAALAPALADGRPSRAVAVFAWTVLAAASLGIFGIGVPVPADRVLGGLGGTMPGGAAVAASGLAVAAGVWVSAARIGRRPDSVGTTHAHRRSR